MKKILVIFSLIAVCSPGFAMEEYYAIKRSVRALGMGGAFYALSDDENALFYNPAGLAEYRGDWELSLFQVNVGIAPQDVSAVSAISNATSGSQSIGQIINSIQAYQGTPLYVNAAVSPPPYVTFHKKNFGISLFYDEKADFALLGRDFDSSVDITYILDVGLVAGYARKFLDDRLAVGINGKGIFRAGGEKTFSVTDIVQGSSLNLTPSQLGGAGFGVDFDLGAIYEIPDLPFGVTNRVAISFNNLLASDFSIAQQYGPPPGLPRMVSLGWFTAFAGYGVIDNFNVLLDLDEFQIGGESDPNLGARTGSFFKHVNFGGEMPLFRGRLAVRAGMHEGYWTLGFGMNWTSFKLDFATYAEELDSAPGRLASRRVALNLWFGIGAPPAGPFLAADHAPTVPKGYEKPLPEQEKTAPAPGAEPLKEEPPGPGAEPLKKEEPTSGTTVTPGPLEDKTPSPTPTPPPAPGGGKAPKASQDKTAAPKSESKPDTLLPDNKYAPSGGDEN